MVAEILARSEDTVAQPAEIFRRGDQLMIALYPSDDAPTLEVPLGEFLAAIGKGLERLGW
jgi:hypothetical protein